MMSDPWSDLRAPSRSATITAKRVDAACPWGFFWARAINGQCLFIVQHDETSSPTTRLPRLNGVEVTQTDGHDGIGRMLVYTLHDAAHRTLFHRLCLDIVSSVSNAQTERDMVRIAVARTWRWHHLLRGGGDQRLPLEEQKGLIGELVLIEQYLLPELSPRDAVTAWRGPLGAAKDFEIGRFAIEVKARRGAAAPFVTISSESQLDDAGLAGLFLCVVDITQAPTDSGTGLTITEVASRVQQAVALTDAEAGELLTDLLNAAGFRWSDDYSDVRWLEGTVHSYRVGSGFPRLSASQMPTGVSEVRYRLSLVDADPFTVTAEELLSSIRGGNRNAD